jgi:hypothetical protein
VEANPVFRNKAAILLVLFASVVFVGVCEAQLTVPVVVGKFSIRNTTTALSNPVVLFTAKHDGLFRVSTYVVLTKTDPIIQNSYFLSVAIGYQDDGGQRTAANLKVSLFNAPSSAAEEKVSLIQVKAGSPIVLGAALINANGATTPNMGEYSLYAVVEYLAPLP